MGKDTPATSVLYKCVSIQIITVSKYQSYFLIVLRLCPAQYYIPCT